MEKTYDPHSIEEAWYQRWEDQGYFAAHGDGDPYCIVIPPPNVTGSLHMGHAFQDTIMDTLIRYHRMKGDNTLWQPGTDHAGIATQMVVERQLGHEGKTRHDLGRDAFTERVWKWKAESGGTITRQLRRMGASPDWSRERFTMDDGLSAAVQEVFIKLYEEDLIYRGKRLVNWDPVLHTAISDLEVINEEEKGFLYHVRYPLVDGPVNGITHLEIATTRPETILADGALAVNPSDKRYRDFIGKQVQVPRTPRVIPIITDDYVDPEFGTGCVKITPAHDFNDYEVGQRHEMEVINLFTIDAIMNENAPPAYQGMDRFEAREQIVKDLDAEGLLVKAEEHVYKRPYGDRSGVVIEPYLTDQWFVRAEPLAEPSIEAVKDGRIRFIPENWSKTYYNWMEEIQDWCISRQIWWGHRIPAWYDNYGNVYVASDIDAVRKKYGLAEDIELTQDEDVLDTWFSSALWPFSTLGWPERNDPALKTFYPTSVLVTGFDIIFFWVARMIMFGLKFMDDVPFREVYIHGLVRDADGNKMSKSKGNVLDPLDLIDGIPLDDLVTKRTTGLMQPEMAPKIEAATRRHFPEGIPAYGTDALRFTFTALATTGRDIRFDLGRIEGYRNFCNKLWNATRYVLQNTEGEDCTAGSPTLADRWIIARLQQVSADVATRIDGYRFDLVARDLYEFVWNDYCDWYIELSKPVLYGDDYPVVAKKAARHTLVTVLEAILRLLHPVMPYITEELWQRVAPLAWIEGDTIMRRRYPETDSALIDMAALAELEWVKTFVMGVRQIRSEMDIKPGKLLPVICRNGDERDRECIENNRSLLLSLAKLESIAWLEQNAPAPESATSLVGEMQLLIPLAGLIDKDSELQRLQRNIEKLEQDAQRINAKLSNENFLSRAPKDVVDKEKRKLADAESALSSLRTQAEKISAI
ncbi:MAG: valine--tRNA ligase [Gammaproteobacteria bacterium]|nr:valine--tRNA ligase [Gammaproteobacteria bacterium]MDH3856706.1 valine--tRNA ligase [Gammaproteobacteria bacterium]